MLAAERGSESARLALEGPECPASLLYLLGLAYAVHGRSGVGMSGLAPLSWTTLDAMCRLSALTLDAEDIDGLFVLDSVMLNPTKPEGTE